MEKPTGIDDLVARAREFATQAHRHIDQRRKYSNQPYEVHLKGVVHEVANVTDDQEVIAAAWLHDIVEDTDVTIGDIRRKFGERVALMVSELTDVSRPSDGNRAVRKALDRAHLAKASSATMTIKLADLMDNCRDICRHDQRFGKTYLKEMEGLLNVLGKGDERLYRRARSLWTKEANRLGVQLGESRTNNNDGAAIGDAQGIATAYSPGTSVGAGWQMAKRFDDLFVAGDIAESALSFDAALPQKMVKAAMEQQGHIIPVAILYQYGRPVGLVLHEDLTDSPATPVRRPFRTGQIVPTSAPLTDVIEVLTRQDVCVVEALGRPCGLIFRRDMQKPQIRMWLFGIITLIELSLTKRIQRLFPYDSWIPLMPTNRLEKAMELYDERKRLGQSCALIDCLQLADKSTILLNDPNFPQLFAFNSRTAAKHGMSELQSLRNNLAHTQDIVTKDWAQIARIARELAQLED